MSRALCLVLVFALPALVGLSLAGVLPPLLCPLRHWTGACCPMCGTTRACLAFFSGQFARALVLNPVFWLWAFWIGVAYFDLCRQAFFPRSASIGKNMLRAVCENRRLAATHILLVLAAVIYLNRSLLPS